MSRPKWQIEVPISFLSFEEQREIEESTPTPLGPEEALEVIEEVAEVLSIEVAIRLHDLHLAGMRITIDIARELLDKEK